MARSTGPHLWLVAILLVAAALRLSGVAWDGGIGAHPDERYLMGVAEGMARPLHLNPFWVDPAYPYGHLPLYLLLLLGGTDQLMAARLLTGLLDVGTVALTAALARTLMAAGGRDRRRGALMAALFLAVTPLHVQQAHFATADVPLAFFSTGALFFAARAVARSPAQSPAECYLAGIWAGLALGCKAGAALLSVPVALAGALGAENRRERIRRAVGALGAALATFAVTNPFAVLEFPRFLTNVATQAALARGVILAPYTLQYRWTLPYLYPIAQQLVWGMGPVLELLGFGGLAWTVARAARGQLSPAEWVVLAWALPFFALTGGLYVKFPRYLLPLIPVLAVYATQGIAAIARGPATRVLSVLAALPAAFLSLALVVSYNRPHPWVAASEWIRAHLPPGSVIAVEEWDHPLPLDAEGYTLRVLPVFGPEGEEKERVIASVLAEADAVVIASRRGYGALARWPDRFPTTLTYYRALFAGERGFTTAGCWGRWPSLLGLSLADDPFRAAGLPFPHPACRPAGTWLRLPRLDESFVVYDHPEVVVFIAVHPTD
ncbi:MAG: glycosyltransferase family 39 protein [Thermoflexales bacterium]|nr:glycosyltransferase family 39 protein [Thermoflexales bacterium]